MTIAAIFDMDGPLLRLSNNEDQAYIDAVTEIYGDSRISILWDEYPVRTDTEITKHIIKNLTGRIATQGEIKKLRDKYVRNLKRKIRDGHRIVSTPGIIPLLQNLSVQMTFGVATGNFGEIASLRLRAGGLWHFFKTHCEGSDDGGTKTEILTRLISRLPKTITHVIFIGDSVSDLKAAEECGIEFIGFSEAEDRRNHLSILGCEFIAVTHAQTEEFLFKIIRRK